MKPDKDKIGIHFARAAATYEGQAMVQKQIGKRLIDLMAGEMGSFQGRALEIGCCTGLLTRLFLDRFPRTRELHVNDLVARFESFIDIPEKCKTQLRFISGDIETVSLPTIYDCIFSSSTFHWLHDLNTFLKRLTSHLHADGLLAFTLYGPENMSEIRELTGQGLRYHSLADMQCLLRKNYTLLHCEEQRQRMFFQDVGALLAHLRATGVNALTEKGWSRARLQSFSRQYTKRFSSDQGVPLTYHPMYFLARPR